MKKYTSYHFNHSIRHIIQECDKQSKQNPFDQYILVCDDPLVIEEVCLEYTPTLFNITTKTWNQVLLELLAHNKLYLKKQKQIESLFLIREILEKQKDCLFPSTLSTCKELYTVFEELSLLEEINCQQANTKIELIHSLYKEFIQALPNNQYFQTLDCFHDLKIPSNTHYIFLTDSILYPKSFGFLNKIDNLEEVTIYIPFHKNNSTSAIYEKYCDNDTVLDNDLLTDQLFSNSALTKDENPNIEILYQTTPTHEIQAVVSHIDYIIQKENMSYKDFTIYYPSSDYATKIQETLDLFSMPYNQVVSNNDVTLINSLLLLLEYTKTKKEQDLLNFLDTNVLFVPKINHFKKQYKAYYSINDEDYLILKDTIDKVTNSILNSNTCLEISTILIEFIKEHYSHNDLLPKLLSQINQLSINSSIQLNEYISLLKELSISLPKEKTKQDHIHLYSIEQPYAGIVSSKYQYIVGNNETILPSLFDDSGLLLNKQRQLINNLDTSFMKNKRLLSKIICCFSYLGTKTILSYSMATTTGDELLESSLLKQLKSMYTIPTIDSNSLLVHPKLAHHYFLNNHVDKELSIYKNIEQFIKTKNQPSSLDSIAPVTLSPSQLEVYNGCPYKYFYQNYMSLQQNSGWQLQSNQIGSLVHYLLENNKDLFSSRSKSKEANIDNIVSILRLQIDEYISKDNTLSNISTIPTNKFFLDTLPYDISIIIYILQKQIEAGNYTISETEKRMLHEYDNYTLKGFIDRLDTVDNYLKVIDYKSSSKELDISLAMQGFNIQMLLYMDMLVEQTGQLPGAILYFNTKKRVFKAKSIIEENNFDDYFDEYKMQGYMNPETISDIDDTDGKSKIVKAEYKPKKEEYSGNCLDEQNFHNLMEHIHHHIDELYQNMEEGNISIAPKRSLTSTVDTVVNPCTYCNYRSLCRYDLFYNENVMVEKTKINTSEIGGLKDESK